MVGDIGARRAITAYFRARSALDIEALVALHARTAVVCDPVGRTSLTGHEALRQHFDSFCAGLDDLVIVTETVATAPTGGAASWRSEAVRRDGRAVGFHGIDVFELDRDGLIQRRWSYWDPSDMVTSPVREVGSPAPG